MTTTDRIRQLRSELAELEAEERGDRPLTLEQIRRMSREEVDREWERVRQALGAKDASEREEPAAANRGMNDLLRAATGRTVPAPGETAGESAGDDHERE